MLKPWDNRGISLHEMAKSSKGLPPAEVSARWGKWSLVLASEHVRADLDAYSHLDSGAVATAVVDGEAAPRPAEGHQGPVQLGLWVFPLRLVGERYRVGRVPDVDIVLHDTSVSRFHAAIAIDLGDPHDRVTVTDFGSRNGTLVDEEVVTEGSSASFALRPGLEVCFGQLSLRFRTSISLVELGFKMTPAGVAPAQP